MLILIVEFACVIKHSTPKRVEKKMNSITVLTVFADTFFVIRNLCHLDSGGKVEYLKFLIHFTKSEE
jgi:hypothetical protein